MWATLALTARIFSSSSTTTTMAKRRHDYEKEEGPPSKKVKTSEERMEESMDIVEDEEDEARMEAVMKAMSELQIGTKEVCNYLFQSNTNYIIRWRSRRRTSRKGRSRMIVRNRM